MYNISRNPFNDYLGYGKDYSILNRAANEMAYMKEYGINGDYQVGLFPPPAPNNYLNRIYGSSFGSSYGYDNPYLSSLGINGDYQTAFYPYPAPNVNNPDFHEFGRTRRKKVTQKRKKTTPKRKKKVAPKRKKKVAPKRKKKVIRKKYK